MVATGAAGMGAVAVEPVLLWGIGVYVGNITSHRSNASRRCVVLSKKVNMSIGISFFLRRIGGCRRGRIVAEESISRDGNIRSVN